MEIGQRVRNDGRTGSTVSPRQDHGHGDGLVATESEDLLVPLYDRLFRKRESAQCVLAEYVSAGIVNDKLRLRGSDCLGQLLAQKSEIGLVPRASWDGMAVGQIGLSANVSRVVVSIKDVKDVHSVIIAEADEAVALVGIQIHN
eukprot:scaffold1672_cov155-Ochromonas_danica.AAC.1